MKSIRKHEYYLQKRFIMKIQWKLYIGLIRDQAVTSALACFVQK